MIIEWGKKKLLLLPIALIVLVSLITAGCNGDNGPAGANGANAVDKGSISGSVKNIFSNTIANATVVTTPTTSSVSTDPSGNFTLSNIPIGVYTLTATAPGYSGTLSGVGVAAGGTASVSVVVDATSSGAGGPAYTYALHTMGLVNVISESTGSVIKSIDTDVDGNGTPGDLNTNGTLGSLTPDGKKLYVSNANAGTSMRKVTVIDTSTLTKIKDIETGAVPKHGIVSPDGRWVGVNHWRREPSGKLRVSFISVATDTVYQNIDLTLKNANSGSNQSMHNAWSWDSKYFFTSSYDDDKVYVFRAPTTTGGPFTLASTFDLSVTAPDNNNPHYFAPSNDNKLMFVVTEGPSGTYAGAAPTNTPRIYVVNMDSLTLYTPLFAVLEEGEVIEGHHGNFSLDGKYFYFVNRGPGSNLTGVTVDVYDTATWELAKHVVTSGGGDGHAYISPDGKTVVITKYGTNVLTFLDPANDWAMTDLTVGTGIHVGHITFTSDSKKAFCTNRVDGAVYQIDLSGVTPSVAKKIDLVLPNLTTVPTPIAGTGQVINSYSNIFEISGNLFKQ